MAIAVVNESTNKTVSGSTATSCSCPFPTGTLPGHVLIAFVALQTPSDGSDLTVTGPSGWTQIDSGIFKAGGTGTVGSRLTAWRRTVASGDSSSPSWSWGGIGANAVIGMTAYSGVNGTTPIVGSEYGFAVTSGTTRTSASITTAGARWIISAFADRSGSTYTPGDTQRVQDKLNSSTSLLVQDTNGSVVAGAYSKSVTASIATTVGTSAIIALQAGTNVAPTANAGVDQIAAPGATVTLSGTASDSDGTVASVAWTADGANPAAVTLSGASTNTATFTAPATKGRYTFHFAVTDNLGSTTTDDTVVAVTTSSSRPDAETGRSGTWTIAGGSATTMDALADESDATYIQGPGTSGSYLEHRYDAPAAGPVTPTYRLSCDTGTKACTVELRRGSTVIASWSHTATTTVTGYTQTLTASQQSAVDVDRSDLRLRYVEG